MSRPIEPLEPRRHLAASPVDPTWNFSQDEVNAAAGGYVELQQAIDAGRGRTLVVGFAASAPEAEILIIALDRNGKLDPTFSDDGIAGSGLPVGPPTLTSWRVLATEEGYVYVANGSGVVRLRGNGTRDRSFGSGRAVDFTGGEGPGHTMAIAENGVGGVDIVRTTGDLFGVVGTPALDGFDGRVRLIRVTGEGPRGTAVEIWQRAFGDDVPNTNPDETAPHLVQASVAPQVGGGWGIVTARQRMAYYYPNSLDTDLTGDVDVYRIKADGTLESRRTFNIGISAYISHVNIHSRGNYVGFAYGNGTRRLTLESSGRVYRETLVAGPGTPGLPRRANFAVDGRPIIFNAGYTDDFAEISLLNANGTLQTTFANGGKWDFSGVPIEGAYTFSVEYAHPGYALVGWTTSDRSSGTRVYAKHLYRIFTGQGPAAQLSWASVRDGRATVTVRYSSPSGIAPGTVGSQDLYFRSTRHGYQSIRLIDRVTDGDSIIARYRTDVLPRGTYVIELAANQIGTLNNVANAHYALLGYLTR